MHRRPNANELLGHDTGGSTTPQRLAASTAVTSSVAELRDLCLGERAPLPYFYGFSAYSEVMLSGPRLPVLSFPTVLTDLASAVPFVTAPALPGPPALPALPALQALPALPALPRQPELS